MASKALLVECNLLVSYSIALEKLYPSTHGRWLLSPTPKVLSIDFLSALLNAEDRESKIMAGYLSID
jgi:hypothetical protein